MKNFFGLNILGSLSQKVEKSIPDLAISIVPILAIIVAIVSTIFIPLTVGNDVYQLGGRGAVIIMWFTVILLTLAGAAVPMSILNALKDAKITIAEIIRTLIYIIFIIFIVFFILGPKLYTVYITSTGLQDYLTGGFTLDLWLQALKSGVSSQFHCTDNIRNITDLTQLNAFIEAEKLKGVIYIDRDQFNKLILFEYCCLAMGLDMIWGILATLLGITRLSIFEVNIAKTNINSKITNKGLQAKLDIAAQWIDIMTAEVFVIDWASIPKNLIPSSKIFEKLEKNDIDKFLLDFDKFITSPIIRNANPSLNKEKPSKEELIKAIKSNTNINNAVRGYINSINAKWMLDIKK